MNRRQIGFLALGLGLFLAIVGWLHPPQAETISERAQRSQAFVDSIGVATHLRYLDTAYQHYDDLIKPRLKELGVQHIRDGFGLGDGGTRQKLRDLATLGIHSTLVMDPRNGMTPSEAVAIAKSVTSSVEAIEGPNEWDVNPKLTYAGKGFPSGVKQFQTALYVALKRDLVTNPLPVISPSLARPNNAAKIANILCDLGNMHSYAGGNGPTAGLDDKYIPKAKQVCRSRPIVATECGWHNALSGNAQAGIPIQVAGKYVSRLYLEYFRRGIQRAFIYELIDERKNASNSEDNFGLLYSNGAPKPSFTALKNLIALLKDTSTQFKTRALSYSLSDRGQALHHSLFQKHDGRFYLVLWQELPSFDQRTQKIKTIPDRALTLTLQTPIRQAKLYNPLKSATAMQSVDRPKSLKLKVPDHPVVVELLPG
ncbi:MAG: hypothetical protein KME16_11565 [Scytolyngbya sp. HA4215-MV1]|jgi:hypothetical protein|nr:hypothetical protein [Scytolyngbya sp. HA4215-MV1]